MSYYSLPKIPKRDILTILNPIYSKHIDNNPYINITLSQYLEKVKSQIDLCQDEWDRFKKYTNPYEYIHTNVPGMNQSICKLKPLSRSFYKMIEIYGLMYLDNILQQPDTSIYYLAEGPGGFIEAITWLHNNMFTHYGISLIDESDLCEPGWKKSKIGCFS